MEWIVRDKECPYYEDVKLPISHIAYNKKNVECSGRSVQPWAPERKKNVGHKCYLDLHFWAVFSLEHYF